MLIASVVLFWVACALYIVASVLYGYQFFLRRSAVGRGARWCVGLGFIAQTLAIGAESMVNHGTLLTGSNIIVLASWVSVLVYFVFEHLLKIKAYGAFFIPIAVVLMCVGKIMGITQGEASQAVYYGWPLLTVHLTLIFVAAASFILAGVAAGLLIYQENALKKHKSTKFSRRIPSLSALKSVSRKAVLFGFPLLTIGMILGAIRAMGLGVSNWYIEPRIILTTLLWIIYGLYLIMVYRRGATVRSTSYIAVVGAVVTILLLIFAATYPIFNSVGA